MRSIVPTTLCLFAACTGGEPTEPLAEDLIFAAVEEDSALAVIDGESGALLRIVDASESAHGATVRYEIHNVQAAPDGAMVWMTAMPAEEGGGHGGEPMPEQLVGVDAITLEVTARIELGEGLHVAHVVMAGTTAYVTANEADAVVVVNLAAQSVTRRIALDAGTGPHGARMTADGRTLVVAGMGDGSIHLIDTVTDAVTSHDLPGRAVQAAVLPDQSAAFVTIYDTQQLARVDLATHELALFDLPPGSVGPVQLYPAPDGSSLWVADQGLLEDDPSGNQLVELDAATGAVLQTATVAPGPHGVVVSADGARVWTTTLENGTVQSVDAASGDVLTTVAVGNRPNGITCVHAGGVMP